jgi:di/tricarboxylate transporter
MLEHLTNGKTRNQEKNQLIELSRKVWLATGLPISLVLIFFLAFLTYSEMKKAKTEESEAASLIERDLSSQDNLIR